MFACVRGQKIHGANITLYTVLIINSFILNSSCFADKILDMKGEFKYFATFILASFGRAGICLSYCIKTLCEVHIFIL